MLRGKDLIRLPDDTIMTVAEALDARLLEVRKVDRFYSPRAKDGAVVAYFANIPGTQSGYRITASLYKSRMGMAVVGDGG